ncbi:MAG: GtrA family protein, partial [Mesorhizobium sp.]|nr:GtrA family protein [Mesorhizobium sp.]
MTAIAADRRQATPERALIRIDLLAALAVALLSIGIAALGGFATLIDTDDSDSLVRMVEVRDLIAGQGWFDLMQYRLGPEGGVLMHWSRLVDAPLAAIVLFVRGLTGSMAWGEIAAAVLWPSLLLGVGVFLLVRMARIAHGAAAALPALAVGGIGLMTIGIFQPAAIDHHNLQLVLTLGMAAGLLTGCFAAAAAAGACAALSIAVGMETLPYVAVGGLIAGGLLLFRGSRETPTAMGFGLGFAATAAAAFAATVPARDWLVPACDAFSVAQGAIAVPAGLGLAMIAGSRAVNAGFGRRLAALGLLGAALGALALVAFPQCLADPYAGLDPRLKTHWLDSVTEARSIVGVARFSPSMLVAWYVTPLLALAVFAVQVVRLGARRQDAILGALLVAAILVSLWQVRGALFAIPLGVIPLAGWIARRRAAALADAGLPATLAMALAWLLSMNIVWSTGAGVASQLAGKGRKSDATVTCYRAADYAALAGLPAANVLAISNLGPGILNRTQHRALSGPYHRNVAGNLATLDMFMADPAAAAAMAETWRVGLVAFCPGNSETRALTRAAPGGLLAAL